MSARRGPALVVFAKVPEAGQVKTRMCPPFRAAQARDFYACLLDDVLEVSAAAAKGLGMQAVLAVTPGSGIAAMAERAPAGFEVRAQRGVDLGARMQAIVGELAAEGFGPILLRGSDSPCLGAALIEEALEALEDAELAVSPDPDGGYSLIGLAAPAPGLFEHPMSTASVLGETLRRARDLGLRVRTLTGSFDIDTVDDLGRLATARREAAELLCVRTLAYLDRERLWLCRN